MTGANAKIKHIYVGENLVRPTFPIPTSGLLGYRPLQSDLKDASGNGKNGTWQGGTGGFSTVGGYTGARVTENNYLSSSYIYTGINTIPGQKTYCAWAYFDYFKTDVYNWEVIMGGSDNTNLNTLAIRNGTILFGWSNPASLYYQTNFLVNTRYFFTYTQSSVAGKLYINGNLVAETTGSWTIPSMSASLYLGRGLQDTQGMSGYIRHCAVYNKSLTDAEVLQFYNNTK